MTNLDLNLAQKEAVNYHQGPLLVLAGAGTGKTRVLTEKITNIINSYLADPKEILAVTFTNKAASEMKHRIFGKINDSANNIWMGTFHGIAARILKRHPEIVGLKPDFTIIDPDDVTRLLKQITTELEIDHKEYPIKNYQYQIERLKDKAWFFEDDEIRDKKIPNVNLPKFIEVYRTYQSRLQALNATDFGDLLIYNLRIFSKAPEILNYYQNKFRYILVDEYQDTNNAQYLWLLRLADKHKNICCVGDDDQSIYSWRGAEINNILRFEKDFPGTKIIRLEQNYRSTGFILKAASHLIKNNQKRHGKTLWTNSSDGKKIILASFFSDKEEAGRIGLEIKKLNKNGTKLNDIAILVRAGYQTRSFEEAFVEGSLPYRIVGGLRFYQRREILDIIAYLRVIANNDDDLALLRIINLPKRGLGDQTVESLIREARHNKSSLLNYLTNLLKNSPTEFKGKAKTALKDLVEKIINWQELVKNETLKNLAKTVMDQSGYLVMWQNDKTPEAATRVENLKEFLNSLEEFDNLGAFLEHVSLVAGNEANNDQLDMVNIMTVHSAKGLEFDTVFIPGLEEGIFPSIRNISTTTKDDKEIEEERRLFYVAITRAKNNLYLSYVQNRFVFGSFQPGIMSRFLKELPEEVLEIEDKDIFDSGFGNFNFSPKNYQPKYENQACSKNLKSDSYKQQSKKDNLIGRRVFHQKFGYGEVVETNGDKLQISFEKSGIKTIIKTFIEFS